MIALALDHAPNNTGWAIGSPKAGRIASGVFHLKSWGDNEPERVDALYEWLCGLIQKHEVTHVFYELWTQQSPDRRNGRKTAAFDLNTRMNQGAVVGVIWLASRKAAGRPLPCSAVPISSWRSRFLGTTKATPGLAGVYGEDSLKDKALRVCAKRGWLVEDHNEAEALGILDYSLCSLDRHYAGATDGIFRRAELTEDTARVRARAEGR